MRAGDCFVLVPAESNILWSPLLQNKSNLVYPPYILCIRGYPVSFTISSKYISKSYLADYIVFLRLLSIYSINICLSACRLGYKINKLKNLYVMKGFKNFCRFFCSFFNFRLPYIFLIILKSFVTYRCCHPCLYPQYYCKGLAGAGVVT